MRFNIQVVIPEPAMHLASCPIRTNRTKIFIQLPLKKCSNSAKKDPYGKPHDAFGKGT
jgi:hypothetical protein